MTELEAAFDNLRAAGSAIEAAMKPHFERMERQIRAAEVAWRKSPEVRAAILRIQSFGRT